METNVVIGLQVIIIIVILYLLLNPTKKIIVKTKIIKELDVSVLNYSQKELGVYLNSLRVKKGISINKMSKDMFGNRYRVNWISNIEKGKINAQYQSISDIYKYLINN